MIRSSPGVPPLDVAVAGGGLAGLTFAIATRQGLGPGCRIAVFDPGFARPSGADDPRASAVSAGTRRMLDVLGLWSELAGEAQPIRSMSIGDSSLGAAVRPFFLTFEGRVGDEEPFAHMVRNAPLAAALRQRAADLGIACIAAPILSFSPQDCRLSLGTGTGAGEARLLVAADGARSRLRAQAGIPFYGWRYRQSALSLTVEHERPHDGRAIEHFLPAGPFATLPLAGNRCSVVWTERTQDARRIAALDADDIDRLLERRMGLEFGRPRSIDRVAIYPLELGLARRFVATRLALLGDAAHVIHPIAGQGLNLGMKDAAALAETVVDHMRLGYDPGDETALAVYERARRFDSASMAMATDALNRLFSNDSGPLRALRDLGLGMVDRLRPAKDFFIGRAAATAGSLPRLMQGRSL